MHARQRSAAAGNARTAWMALGALGVVGLLALSVTGAVPSFGGAAAPTAHGSMGSVRSLAVPATGVRPNAVANVVTLENVTFKEMRLPDHSVWNVTAGSPPVTKSNTTSGRVGSIVFTEPNGTLNFTISGPAGWGVAKIEGSGTPSQSQGTVNGTTEFTVFFAPLENVTFTEKGLAPGTVWGVNLTTALPHGGPIGTLSETSNGTTVVFHVVKGTYHYVVFPVPSGYSAHPAQGAVGVGHPEKSIRFHQATASVVFHELGLPHGTLWQVNVTGPVNEKLNSTRSNIRFVLPAGTYAFTAWNFSTHHPVPASGTFTVVAPGNATSITINYTAPPVVASPALAPAYYGLTGAVATIASVQVR